MGTGQNCTKTMLHEVTKFHDGTKLHQDTLAQRQIYTKGHFCTRIKIIK